MTNPLNNQDSVQIGIVMALYGVELIRNERTAIVTHLLQRAADHRAIAATAADDETRYTALMYAAVYDEIARFVQERNG